MLQPPKPRHPWALCGPQYKECDMCVMQEWKASQRDQEASAGVIIWSHRQQHNWKWHPHSVVFLQSHFHKAPLFRETPTCSLLFQGLPLTIIQGGEKEAALFHLYKAGLSDFHGARPAGAEAEPPWRPARKVSHHLLKQSSLRMVLKSRAEAKGS
jgi:hypothetical protein